MDILACLLMLSSYFQLKDWQIDTLTDEDTASEPSSVS